jgi:tRNA/tmRNA/rRNA uracil-C5-methylase (TrmA/RlmC/RlmD family)
MRSSEAIEAGQQLTLEIERPAAGGRMLAHHAGQVALVAGAIPGERVTGRVERVGRGVIYVDTRDVLVYSSGRRIDATSTSIRGAAGKRSLTFTTPASSRSRARSSSTHSGTSQNSRSRGRRA